MMLSFTKNETLLLDAYHKAGIFAASKMLIVTLTVYYWKTRYIRKNNVSILKSKKNNVSSANYKLVSTIKLETKTT